MTKHWKAPIRGRVAHVEVGDRVVVRNRLATEGHSIPRKGTPGGFLEVTQVLKGHALTIGQDIVKGYHYQAVFVFENGTKLVAKANNAITYQKPRSEQT